MQRMKKLDVKLMGFVFLQAFLLIVISMFSFGSKTNKLANQLMEEQLEATSFLTGEILSNMNNDDYQLVDGQLCKGDFNLTTATEALDNVKAMTGLEVTILWGDVRKATTVFDQNGNRLIDTKLDSSTASMVLGGSTLFLPENEISGVKYATYYRPLMQPSTGEIVGIVFTGKPRSVVDRYVDTNVLEASGIMFIVSIVFVGIGCVTFLRIITKALLLTSNYLAKLAAKDLSSNVENRFLKRQDEIGDISRSLDLVKESLHEVIGGLQESSAELGKENKIFLERFHMISENIGNINIAVEEIAKGSTDQAWQTSKASGSIANIGVALDQNADDVQGLNGTVQEMNNYAEQAYTALKELLDVSQKTSQEVTVLKEETNNTNESAQKINEAVSLIQGIAQQTNLLSLNASIEAARAGDSGRGFAVVAEEIRNLSEGSSKGAEQIASIVSQLIHDSNVSVERMDSVERNVEQQMSQLEDLNSTFTGLGREISKVSGAAENISEQMKSVTVMKEEISSIIEQLAAISQENAASTEETSASMQDLSNAIDECMAGTDTLLNLSDEFSKKANAFTL